MPQPNPQENEARACYIAGRIVSVIRDFFGNEAEDILYAVMESELSRRYLPKDGKTEVVRPPMTSDRPGNFFEHLSSFLPPYLWTEPGYVKKFPLIAALRAAVIERAVSLVVTDLDLARQSSPLVWN